MLNTFVWQLYRESERGKQAIKHVSNFSAALEDGAYLSLLFGLSFDEAPEGYPETDPDSANVIRAVKAFAAERCVTNLEQAAALVEELVSSGLPFCFSGEAEPTILNDEDLTSLIQTVSIGLHLAHPEHFIPYGLVTLFADLQRIAELFNLALPPVPGKRDTKGRLRYYAQLNAAFHEFRKSYDLSTVEMCAFLHDFAPRFLEDKYELPEPAKVWPVVAGVFDESDFQWLENAVEHSLSPWNGSANIRRGDVLLVYCTSPHNAIRYLARAITDGFVDPFYSLYSVVWVGEVQPIPPITFKELAAQPQLAQSSVIKTRMQGPNSGSFTLEQYSAILGIFEAKGLSTANLPKPVTVPFLPDAELLNERDVETKLIESLLKCLGYAQTDWLRQMRLRMGRGERVYPDYVFGAKVARGEEQADMVLEAKLTISSERALRETYQQAMSYAYRLRAKVVLLAAREGLWLFGQKRGAFSAERYTVFGWDALCHPDTLFRLKQALVKPRR